MQAIDVLQAASNAVAGNVTGPVDILSLLMRKIGVPVPENAIGSSQWAREQGLLRDVDDPYARAAGESLGIIAPMVAAAKAPQIARGLLKAGDNLAAPRMLDPQTGAIVWHGSPHKFDKFDSSKIGTGEGAQAYGHGLYLADSPAVAKGYADTLSQYHIATKDGVKAGGDFADFLVANAGQYPASLSSAIRSQANKIATDLANGKPADLVISSMRNGPYARMYAGLADAVEKLAPTKAGGSLYKVDLPDEKIARMLDWDAKLSDQPAMVQQRIYDSMIDAGFDKPLVNHILNNKTGAELLNELGGRLAVRNPSPMSGSAQASEFVKKAGIPGIRYLDGGSRGAGQGTRNYVVFPGEEALLTILERNGIPLP
jgi:hypothetical protein